MIERRNYFLPSVRYKDCLSLCFCSLLRVFYFLYNFVIMGSACFPSFNFALMTFRGFLSKNILIVGEEISGNKCFLSEVSHFVVWYPDVSCRHR